MAIVWLFSLQLWILLDAPARFIAYATLDLMLAAAFCGMSGARVFPIPLFFLHGALVCFHLYTAFIGPGVYWMQAFLNRALDLELTYIVACAGYRIREMRKSRAVN